MIGMVGMFLRLNKLSFRGNSVNSGSHPLPEY